MNFALLQMLDFRRVAGFTCTGKGDSAATAQAEHQSELKFQPHKISHMPTLCDVHAN